MIYSMTGFAVATRELTRGALNLELRSVNHRYLDVQLRLPEELRLLEPALREVIISGVTRGKVDCRLSLESAAGTPLAPQLNTELLQQLVEMNLVVRAALPDARSLSVADILRWPGLLGSDSLSPEDLREPCVSLLHKALDELNATRRREGEKLKGLLLERIEKMERLVAEVAPRIPEIVAAYREKLGSRLSEALINREDDRIRQEFALFAAKIDVDEELTRLSTHLGETRQILEHGGAVGKRLDFLMQELNREANTLGSKSVDSGMSKVAMELKVLIEQMREQIQNIE
ncbi:MAG TPA: YicC/YloC family endoribonuclease [Burkholderiales bacterium]|nr:YicC/YloC family endoribonuclease [Burkholderiales bacterium]